MEKNKLKIGTPLAKYDSKGKLICIICKNLIKSAAIWKVHVNSKLHKSNVEEAKQINKELINKHLNKPNRQQDSQTALNTKKVFSTKKLREIPTTDNKLKKNISTSVLQQPPDLLPEMFFDDPIVDAKIRHVEYKNVEDDEWERFRREIKEESLTSNKLIFGEQINSAVERELTEISEQIRQWSKVIDLENKLEKIIKIDKRNFEILETDEDISDDEDINENLDWRSKKFS